MGITRDLQRWQRILLSVVVAMLALGGVLTYWLVRELRGASQAVSYDHAERLIGASGLESAAFARSASARGYLLSGDRLFLDHRITARREVDTHLADLRRRRVDARALAAIGELLRRLDAASDRAIAAYPDAPEVARTIWDREARHVQDQLSQAIGELVAVERAAFATAREHAAEASARAATLLAVLLGAVGLLVTLLFYGYARATRALVERQKAEQEQTTFRLLEEVPVGIFVMTADGAPYYANRHAQKLLGRGIVKTTPQDLATTYGAFEAGTDRAYPTERLPIVRALVGETSECTDLEIRRGDEVVPLHIVGAPVHDARGELLYAVAGFQDVRELRRVAMRDALTGLANRAAIAQIFTRERAVSVRGSRPFALALLDLDRFKLINDTHGHAAGDEVLKRVAVAITGCVRRSDAVGRWGGEEMIVLFPNTDARGAEQALDKVLAAVRTLTFAGKAGETFAVTFSAGAIAVAAGESLDEAVARADELLYEAKSAGRNRVRAGPTVPPIADSARRS